MQPEIQLPHGRRYHALDSWRGIAACLVATFHFVTSGYLSALPFIRNSYLFVDFFFVLSGFVIAANYRQRILDGFPLGRFFWLRFARLYPLHLFLLVLFFVPELGRYLSGDPVGQPPFTLDRSVPALVANLFLVHSLGLFDRTTWNHPSWSISLEAGTYVLFALALVLQRFLKPPKAVSSTVIAAVLIGCPLVIGEYSTHGMDTTFDYGIFRSVLGFTLGAIMHRLSERRGERPEAEAYADSERSTRATLLELASVVTVFVYVSFAAKTKLSIAAPFVFCFPVIVFAEEAGLLSAFLLRRSFLALGAWSYSIYLVHLFVQQRLLDLGHWLQDSLGISLFRGLEVNSQVIQVPGAERWQGDVATLLMLATLVAVSALSYRFIEVPWRIRLRSFAGEGRTQASQAVLA